MAKYVLFISALFLCACSTTIKKPFLYEIEKNRATSYLLGTQHLGVPYYDLPDEVFEKLDQSNGVFVESFKASLDKAQAENKKMADRAVERLIFLDADDKPLGQRLKPATWKFVQTRYGKKYGEERLNALSPLAINNGRTRYVSDA